MKYVQEKVVRNPESRLVPRMALSASMGFAAYWTYLYFSQTRHIFSPALKHHEVLTHHAHEFTELRLQVAPGVELEGWVRMPAGMGGAGSKAPCAIYFGGRSEDVRWLLNEAQGFKNLPLVFSITGDMAIPKARRWRKIWWPMHVPFTNGWLNNPGAIAIKFL